MKLLNLLLILILCVNLYALEEKAPIEIRAENAILDKNKKITILSGNVTVRKKDLIFKASCVRLFGELEDLIKIIGEGKIELIDHTNKAVITAGYIEYDCKKEYGSITQNPTLRLDNLKITSSNMKYFFKEEEFIATGDVKIHYQDSIAKAGEATYYRDGRLVLKERPEIIKSLNRFSGETITIYTKEERLEINGGVSGTILAINITDNKDGNS